MNIRLTVREQAMQIADKEGYDAYPYGPMPEIYKGEKAKHLAEAWKAGFNRHRDENNWACDMQWR